MVDAEVVTGLVAAVVLEVVALDTVPVAVREVVFPETVAGLVVVPDVALEVVAVVLAVVAVVLVVGVSLVAVLPVLVAEVTLLADALAPVLPADDTLVGFVEAVPCLTGAELP